MSSTLAEYFAALAAADPMEALAVLEKAYQEGTTQADLVRHVIAPAQNIVGDQWLQGIWGVADEHAATSVAEQVLAVFAPPESPLDAERVVWMACAEGEWHTFPPRLAAALARRPRMRLLALGGSISGEHLQRYLSKSRPDALALSATMPVNLVGAARSIRAAREAGVPVVVGGAAWGEGQCRARALGAQAFVSDPADLAATVEGLRAASSAAEDVPVICDEVVLLERPSAELMRGALERQRRNASATAQVDAAHEQRSLEDLTWMARHAAAAVLCDDVTIVRDAFDWLMTLRKPDGVAAGAVLESALHLADEVETLAPRAAAILRMQALVTQAGSSATQRVAQPVR